MSSTSLPHLRKFVAPEFVFGVGSLNLAGQYARNLGGRKALIVSDPGVTAAGWLQRVAAVVEAAGVGYTTFTNVTPNPRVEQVSAGADVFAENDCDLIVAVGGGSAIDCGKAIGVLASNGGEISDFVGVDNIRAPMPPTISIPTTAGTSADVSQFAVVSDRQALRKLLIISKALLPDISLIDPETTTTMDPYLTACAGLDAFTHAVEAYVSIGHSPLTDIHAIQAIRLITENLLKSLAEPNNLDYRSAMMLASLEAGMAFSNASLGAGHAMAHSIGGMLDLAHGECNALVLDHVVDFNFPNAGDRYQGIAEAMGLNTAGLSEKELRSKLMAAMRGLREAAGIRGTLSNSGVHPSDVQDLAERAVHDPCIVTNPRTPCRRDIEVIYEECL